MSEKDSAENRRNIIKSVCSSLAEQNYDPIRQLRGYLLSADPTYIPDYKNARTKISEIDREKFLDDLLRCYLDMNPEKVAKS